MAEYLIDMNLLLILLLFLQEVLVLLLNDQLGQRVLWQRCRLGPVQGSVFGYFRPTGGPILHCQGGLRVWRHGALALKREQEVRFSHVPPRNVWKWICAVGFYRRRTSSAASSAPSGGGAAGAPGDSGSLWTPGPSEVAQSPAAARATHAWFLLICPSTPWQPERTNTITKSSKWAEGQALRCFRQSE